MVPVHFQCSNRLSVRVPASGDHPSGALLPSPSKSGIVEAVAHLSIELIERYALRELSEIEIHRVEKHVASCPVCGGPTARGSRFVGGNALFDRYVDQEDCEGRKKEEGGRALTLVECAPPPSGHAAVHTGAAHSHPL
jgi:hypothetical protein